MNCRADSVTWNPHKLMGALLQCSSIHFKEDVSILFVCFFINCEMINSRSRVVRFVIKATTFLLCAILTGESKPINLLNSTTLSVLHQRLMVLSLCLSPLLVPSGWVFSWKMYNYQTCFNQPVSRYYYRDCNESSLDVLALGFKINIVGI